MFLSHEKSPSKMKFQKPNILRKRAKVSSKDNVNEAPESVILGGVPLTPVSLPDWSVNKVTKHKCSKPSHFIIKPMQRKQDAFKLEEAAARSQIVEDNQDSVYSNKVKSLFSQLNNDDNNDFISIQSSHSDFNFEDLQKFDVEVMTLKDYKVSAGPEWYKVTIIDGEDMNLPDPYISQAPPADSSVVSQTQNNLLVQSGATQLKPKSSEQVDKPCVSKLLPVSSAATFMCDVPSCSKEFPSQQKLKKHKSTHNKTGSPKNAKQVIECPAYKLSPENWLGEDKRTCGRQFNLRAELLKHLKEEHTLDDAAYRCEDCRRPFFWASGVRNHARACLASGRARRLACQWPECGRVFQQPCRLKEHVRAHTGDKPYPCRHPNCTWSFRTASKLLRHARRHTDERRHPCAHCGRAFLRGEHLRDHAARHHGQPGSRRPRRERQSPQQPPQQTEPNAVNTSLLSLQELAPEEVDETSTPATIEPVMSTLSMQESAARKVDSDWSDGEDLFLSSEMRGNAAQERAARTHCTWPLPRRPPAVHGLHGLHGPEVPDVPDVPDVPHVPLMAGAADVGAHAQLDEGVYEVELSEGSESKIYTIRSDLFLHGNLIHNEDSESGVAVIEQTVEESNGATLQGTPLDAELGLLDTHSSIDLMQDELMYTDEAVDGSFQLLSDGDLQTYYTHGGVSGVRLNSV